jgi:hemolysin III
MVAIYLIMGWLFVLAGKQIIVSLSSESLLFLILGGVAYSVGVVFYMWRKLPYGHGIWHLFVLAGSVLHFFAIYFTIE